MQRCENGLSHKNTNVKLPSKYQSPAESPNRHGLNGSTTYIRLEMAAAAVRKGYMKIYRFFQWYRWLFSGPRTCAGMECVGWCEFDKLRQASSLQSYV